MGKKKTAPIGEWNKRFAESPTQIIKGHSYSDKSTVCFTPSLGKIPVRVVQAMNGLIKPMNQKWGHIYLVNQEVGAAYEQMVDILRSNSDLQKFKYVLTWEEDNVPPPDGLLKLQEDIEASKFDAVGGLYWTKGEGGQPMCYGRPEVMPLNFAPWLPPPNSVAQCRGLGQGFTLYRTKMFLDDRWQRPIFKTEQSFDPQKGVRQYTQDLFMFETAAKHGYRVGCSTRCLVGHLDPAEDKMW